MFSVRKYLVDLELAGVVGPDVQIYADDKCAISFAVTGKTEDGRTYGGATSFSPQELMQFHSFPAVLESRMEDLKKSLLEFIK